MPPTPLPVLGSAAVMTLSAEGSDARLSAATAFDGRWLGGAVRLLDAAGTTIGTFAVLEVDAGGSLLLAGAAAAAGQAVSYQGVYRFDSIELRDGTGLDASDPVEGGQMELVGDTRLRPRAFRPPA